MKSICAPFLARFLAPVLAPVLGAALLAGCGASTDFSVQEGAVRRDAAEMGQRVNVLTLTAQNVEAFSDPMRPVPPGTNVPAGKDWVYRVGVGDVLDVVVWEHPELNNPAGQERSPAEAGLRVQADGTFFYPYVGQIRAEGLTPEEIRRTLSERLAEYIPNPQVVVRIAAFNSQAASVTGAVKSPQLQMLNERPLTLLDAINAAGGLTEEADPARVTLKRNARSYNIDLRSFLDQGLATANPVLRDGDVVNVPELARAEAYLLGQVVTPATVDLTEQSVTLTQALTKVGGLREERADARGVFVFRKGADAVEIYQLDASSPLAFVIGTRFVLRPQDVIYVTTAPVSKWNQIISNILPSVSSARMVQQLQE